MYELWLYAELIWYTISYLGVIRGTVYRILHRCKILYTPDYTKITNLFLMKLTSLLLSTQKNKNNKKQRIEKNAILFSILHIYYT